MGNIAGQYGVGEVLKMGLLTVPVRWDVKGKAFNL